MILRGYNDVCDKLFCLSLGKDMPDMPEKILNQSQVVQIHMYNPKSVGADKLQNPSVMYNRE